MVFSPLQRSIWLCERDCEGRKNSCPYRCFRDQLPREKRIKPGETKPSPHWFIVISRKQTQGFVTALPVTSQLYQKEENSGEELHSEDIEDSIKSKNVWELKKDTLVLCNKPCRIPIEDLKEDDDWGRLKEERYREIIRVTEGCIDV